MAAIVPSATMNSDRPDAMDFAFVMCRPQKMQKIAMNYPMPLSGKLQE
jgi:hypothetical protein